MRLLTEIKESNEITLEVNVIEDSAKEEENARLIITEADRVTKKAIIIVMK